MAFAYLDTSAAMKLLIDESGSAELIEEVDRSDRRIVASWLLHAELHCAAGRRPEDIAADRMRAILDRVLLVDLTRSDLISAGTLAPRRAQDAIHLAVAMRVGAQEILTYDRELADAAIGVGLRVIAPGG